MRWAWLVLAACNQAFGLRETQLPVDAPPVCPAIGTAPAFSDVLHQDVLAMCSYYTPSPDSGMALAACDDGTMTFVGFGAVDQPLQQVAFPPIASTVNLEQPRLVPEGDRAYAVENNYDLNGSSEIGEYLPDGNGGWRFNGVLKFPPALFPISFDVSIGTASYGPHRHVIVSACNVGCADYDLHEIVQQDNGGWLEVQEYTNQDLGTVSVDTANLTPDGLRIVLRGTLSTGSAVLYADRPTIDARFGTATALAGVPVTFDPYLAPDCSRLYFTGLESVWYVQP
jgi:hypothetical protein